MAAAAALGSRSGIWGINCCLGFRDLKEEDEELERERDLGD